MSSVKPVRVRDAVEVVYDEGRWELLKRLRSVARRVMPLLPGSLLVGSVARGDVHEGSDVDIALLDPLPPSLVEEGLRAGGFNVELREVVQATPLSTPKLYMHLSECVKVSVPLARLSKLEEEFYEFAGFVDLGEVEAGFRRAGVNKRLLAVVPTSRGHLEFSVLSRVEEVARLLGVSQDVVRERVGVLLRRDERGRSGLFFRLEVPPWGSVEDAVRRAMRRVPALKERLKGWL